MYKAESRALTGHCTFGNSVYIEYCAMLQRQVVQGGPRFAVALRRLETHQIFGHEDLNFA
jgi:hypothetical protein